MTIYLRKSTASQEIPLGFFLDSADGDSEETGLTIANTSIKLWKAGATTLANKNSGGATHISNGLYYAVLDATDTDTLGSLVIFVHVSGALAVRVDCVVLPENVYDSLIAGTDKLDVNAAELGGTTQTGRNIGASVLLSSGTGTGQISLSSGQVTAGTVADKTGYALTSAYDAAKSAASQSSVNTIDSIVDAILLDTGTDGVVVASASKSGYSLAANQSSVTIGTVTTLTNLPAITANWLTAAGLAADAVTEIQSGLATAANQATIIGYVDCMPASWTTPLNAAEVRSAVGLASANLDTQLGDIPTVAEFEARSLLAASYLNAAGVRSAIGLSSANLDTQLGDIPTVSEFEARTLPAASYLDASGIRSAIGLSSANLDTQLGNIPTVAEFEARSLAAADYFVVSDYSSPPSAESIADAVWDEILAEHTGMGSVGEAMEALVTVILSGADPWETLLPGSYEPGTAGFILGTYLDAVLSDRTLSASSYLEASDIRAAIGLAAANLDTQLGNIPTVSEFEARTLLAASYLDAAGVRSAIGLASANLDSQLGNIPTVSEFEDRTLPAAAYVQSDYVLGFFQLLCRSDSIVTVDRAYWQMQLNADDDGGYPGSYDNRYDSLEALRARSDAVTDSIPTLYDILQKVDSTLEASGIKWKFTEDALSNAPSGGSGGDDPWETLLPGSYEPGTAGFILGTYLDAALTSTIANSLPENFSSLSINAGGTVDSNLVQVGGFNLFGSAEQIAAGMSHFFNVESPALTVETTIEDGVAAAIAEITGIGSGPYACEWTVEYDGTPLAGALVALYLSGTLKGRGTTDEDGRVSMSLAAGPYEVVIVREGYIHSPENYEVTAEEETWENVFDSLVLVASVPSPPSDQQCSGFSYVYDEDGEVESGVTIIARLIEEPSGSGVVCGNAERSEISAVNGLVVFSNLWIGGSYEFRRSGSTVKKFVTISADDLDEEGRYPLPNFRG